MVRRAALFVALAALCLFMAGCGRGGKEPEPTPEAVGANSLPATLQWSGEGEPMACLIYLEGSEKGEVRVDDSEAVAQLWAAAGKISVSGETDAFEPGQDHYVVFLYPDGSQSAALFNGENLDMGEFRYALAGAEEFWALVRAQGG